MPSVTRSVGTVADDSSVGSFAWSNPSNATASDNSRASTATMGSADKSHYLKCTNFGFAIPTGATINGIEVHVEWASLSGFVNARRYRARIVKGGTIGSSTSWDSSLSLPGSDTVETLGGSADLWGETWAASDVNGSTFGVALACQGPSFWWGSADVDHVQITVHYTSYTIVVNQVSEADTALPMVPVKDGTWLQAQWSGSEWSDLTADVTAEPSYSFRRGRPFNLARVETGTATVRLNNETGDYDPANPNSSLYPNVLPLKPVRIRHVRNGVVYDRFTGRIERFRPEWARPGWQFMHLDLADEFDRLANEVIQSDYATLETALSGANNDLVFTAREAGDPGEQVTVEYVVAGTSTPLTVGTNDPTEGIGNVRFEVPVEADPVSFLFRGGLRAFMSPRPSRPATATVVGTDITVNVATDGGGAAASSANDVRTALEANADAMNLLASIDLADGNSGAGTVTAMAKTSLSGGQWQGESTGTRINRVLNTIGYTAARDIDVGQSSVVAQGFSARENVSALAHIQDVADSELGYVFMAGDGTFVFHDGAHRSDDSRSTVSQATYSDDGTGFPYHAIEIVSLEKDRIANEVLVATGNAGAAPQVAADLESQATYQKRTLNRQTRLLSEVDAQSQANSILAAYKDPYTRFDSVTLLDDGSDEWAEAVLAREIGDLVTVRTSPPVADGATPYTIAYDCFIEGIEESKGPGRPIEVTFRLTIADQNVSTPGDEGALLDSSGDDFTLDDATKGVLG